MYIIKEALYILVRFIDTLILIRVLLSFFPTLTSSKIGDWIYQLTEPIMAPCRALLNRVGLGNGMFDFSPILAFVLLDILSGLVRAI